MVAVATFDITPIETPIDVTYMRSGESTTREQGFVISRQTELSNSRSTSKQRRRLFRLRFTDRKKADRDRMLVLWQQSWGGARELAWTPPGDTAITVRIQTAPLRIRKVGAGLYSWDLELLETL